MATRVIWYREEFKGREGELEDRHAFEQRRGLRSGTLTSRMRDYTDRMPPVVREVNRSKEWAREELDKFFDSIDGHEGPRSRAQVLEAEVVRRQGSVKEHEARVAKKEEDLAAARRRLEYHVKQLKLAEQKLAIETGA